MENGGIILWILDRSLKNTKKICLCNIPNGVLKEEMLFSTPLETDTRGETIFMVVKQFCEVKNIPIGNIIACATDGASSKIGCHRGFIAHLKRAVPNVFFIHCVIHRQQLIAKHLTANLHRSAAPRYLFPANSHFTPMCMGDSFSFLCKLLV